MADRPGSGPCIEVEDLQKCYRVGEVAFPALNGVNLRIHHGEFAVLAGRSGSGKTTLLNIIGGLEVPTSPPPTWTPPRGVSSST